MRNLALTLVLGLACSISMAAPIVGTYGGLEGVEDGRWSESFVGVLPSEPGNVVNAASWDGATLGDQWTLSGATVVSDEVVFVDVQGLLVTRRFLTTYTGGTLTLSDGPWTEAGDGPYTVNLDYFTQTTVATEFDGVLVNSTGIINMQGTFAGYPGYQLNYLSAVSQVVGSGATAPAYFPAISTAAGLWGTVDNVQLQIIPEPATMSLLAIGGLLAIRRRRR